MTWSCGKHHHSHGGHKEILQVHINASNDHASVSNTMTLDK